MESVNTSYDFLALGESLIDFISNDIAPSLSDTNQFQRFVGGQATNLAMNMARLGKRAAIASCVGYDGFGNFIREQIDQAGVNSVYLQATREAPTTIVVVTRHTQTPEFIIHRGADAHLTASPELTQAADSTKIIHTSAFALSREPARTTILSAIHNAKENGVLVSLDPNYHPDIWPDTTEFIEIMKDVFQYVDITKPSLDDCMRIFGPRNTPEEYAKLFIDWGAKIVLLSMGDQGVLLVTNEGESHHIQASKDTQVADVTGAGDAYWAGFLAAYLQEESPLEAARIGQVIAEIKITQIGPIDDIPDWDEIKERAKKVKYA